MEPGPLLDYIQEFRNSGNYIDATTARSPQVLDRGTKPTINHGYVEKHLCQHNDGIHSLGT